MVHTIAQLHIRQLAHLGHNQSICNTRVSFAKLHRCTQRHGCQPHQMDNFVSTLHARRCPDSPQFVPPKTGLFPLRRLPSMAMPQVARSACLRIFQTTLQLAFLTGRTIAETSPSDLSDPSTLHDRSSPSKFACYRQPLDLWHQICVHALATNESFVCARQALPTRCLWLAPLAKTTFGQTKNSITHMP